VRRLLCVTAHPDDEAGGFGGSLLRYRLSGVETYVICLTPGQAATNRGGATSSEELAAMRRQEFAVSCELLKITCGEVLDYPDGALERVDFRTVVAELTARIRRIRPQVILTFGPEGAITGHTDHAMASLFATMAFHSAPRTDRFPEQLSDGATPHRPQKLYYATALFTLPDRQPVSLAPATAIIDIAEHVETKIRAFRSHTSQAPLFPRFDAAVRARGQSEFFHLAAANTPRKLENETDLFTGITEE
jgi:LmbE family N-acetylglucosaminyl deacetylase